MGLFSRVSDIDPWAKKLEKRAILSDLTTPSDSEPLVWYEKHYLFLSLWKITLEPFGILSIATMHHYFFSTTPYFIGFPH